MGQYLYNLTVCIYLNYTRSDLESSKIYNYRYLGNVFVHFSYVATYMEQNLQFHPYIESDTNSCTISLLNRIVHTFLY